VGKTSVARRLGGSGSAYLDARGVRDALCEHVQLRGWNPRLLDAPSLVLDGPVWLRNRPHAVAALVELLRYRSDRGRMTLVCQTDEDGSIEILMGELDPGSAVVIGLRFPSGTRGRLRFARRVCDELGLARELARSTDQIEPWGYEQVIRTLQGVSLRVSTG
jgi:hypothetical protein